MKYMILTYGSQQDYDALGGGDTTGPVSSAEETAAIGEFLMKFTADLAASGELVDAQGEGPAAGLALLETMDDPRLSRDHRLHAARAHLLEMSGNRQAARAAYELAARHATNLRHVRYLNGRAQRLR